MEFVKNNKGVIIFYLLLIVISLVVVNNTKNNLSIENDYVYLERQILFLFTFLFNYIIIIGRKKVI